MILFLCLTLLFVAVEAFFSLFEMAAVSFHKIRLQYYVRLKKRRALWLQELLKRPSRLFGTTLIGINTALQIGSECARRFYESVHLDPDWASLSQLVLVVLFAELAPMFAARRHPEQAAFFCVPLIVFLSKIFAPIIWVFDLLSRWTRSSVKSPLFFSREEIRMAFEDRGEGEDELESVAREIFSLKNLTAQQLMAPLEGDLLTPSRAGFSEVSSRFQKQSSSFLLLYHQQIQNIVSILHLRDVLRLSEEKKAIECASSPWFVPQETSVLQILEQFRRNNQTVAVILDPSGICCGFLTLDRIIAQIFKEEPAVKHFKKAKPIYISRVLSGEMPVREFNRKFQEHLPETQETLSEWILSHFDHLPVKGEVLAVGSLLFTIEECSWRRVKRVSVQTIQE